MRTHDIPAGILPTQRDLYYGGAWHAPKAGVYAETINPTYNEVIASAPVADAADVDAAVQAAHAAFPAWAATPPVERGLEAAIQDLPRVWRQRRAVQAMRTASSLRAWSPRTSPLRTGGRRRVLRRAVILKQRRWRP